MHSIQLLPELKQGGVETVVLGLNRELVKAGQRSTVISAGGPLVTQVESDGGQHIELDMCSKNPLTLLTRVKRLESAISDLNPDVLHVHSRVPAWLAWMANKKLRIPLVTSVHGFNSVSKYSEIMTKGDRVICVSNSIRDYIQQHYGTEESIIRTIHPGLEPGLFSPEAVNPQEVVVFRESLNLAEKRIVTSIGRITQLKDYETFIRAVAIASKDDPDVRGLIIGHVREDKKDYFNQLELLIKDLQVEDIVHIILDGPNMPVVYTASDLVVSCSKKPESFGLTLIEALAMNTPVVATRHGGPLDIITEGKNGTFFQPGDSEKLAEILLHPPQLEKTELREDTIQRFNLTAMAHKIINVYSELC